MKRYFFISLVMVLFLPGWFAMSMADTGSPRGKSAGVSLLPDELKSMKVEDYFVESKTTPVGSIQSTTGHVVVVHKDTNGAYFAATGDAVYEQDLFYTLKDSRCRLKFSNEDIITMGENSKVIVDEIVDDQDAQKKSSVISMLKGKAMFCVVRLFKHKTVNASVKTPTAVMGVRGTKFGVDVRKVGDKVADLSDDSFIYLAQNEPGNFETVVYGFDGEVEVTATGGGRTNIVGAGETLVVDSFGAGDVEPMNPNAANQFIQETEGGAGTGWTGGPGGSGWTGGPSWPGGTGGLSWTSWTDGAGIGEVGGGLIGDTGYDPSENVGQNLTFSANDVPLPPPPPVEPPPPPPPVEPSPYVPPPPPPVEPPPESPPVEPPPEPPPTSPTARMGYFTAMLTKSIVYPVEPPVEPLVEYFNNGVFVSSSKQDLNSVGSALDIVNGYVMYVNGLAGDKGKLASVDYGDGGITGLYNISREEIDHNAYMEWGYWTQTTAMTDDYGDDNWVNNWGYYIAGDHTLSMPSSGTYAYLGGAEGTYWTANDGLPVGDTNKMTGGFSADVDFSVKAGNQITNFDLSVSGGGHSVVVEDANGSFAGGSHFDLSGGTWKLDGPDGPTAELTAGHGSFYGPNAKAMGGVWGLAAPGGDITPPQYATGIFHGTQVMP